MLFTRCLVQNPLPSEFQVLFLSLRPAPEICLSCSSTHFPAPHLSAILCRTLEGNQELYVQVGDTCNKSSEWVPFFEQLRCLWVLNCLESGGCEELEELGEDFAGWYGAG